MKNDAPRLSAKKCLNRLRAHRKLTAAFRQKFFWRSDGLAAMRMGVAPRYRTMPAKAEAENISLLTIQLAT